MPSYALQFRIALFNVFHIVCSSFNLNLSLLNTLLHMYTSFLVIAIISHSKHAMAVPLMAVTACSWIKEETLSLLSIQNKFEMEQVMAMDVMVATNEVTYTSRVKEEIPEI